MTDWADEIAVQLWYDLKKTQGYPPDYLAAAIRKARADALEQAAEWFDRKATPISPDVVSYRIRALKNKQP
jgi:hypothetical protein